MGSYRLSKPIRPHKARGRGAGGRGNMKGKDGIEIEPDAPNVGNGVIDICFGPCHDMCAMLLFRIGVLYRRKQSFNMCGGETTFTRNDSRVELVRSKMSPFPNYSMSLPTGNVTVWRSRRLLQDCVA